MPALCRQPSHDLEPQPLRRIHVLRLRASSEPSLTAARILVQDAVHTASLPSGPRLYVFRRLSLGSIHLGGSAATVALHIEDQLRQLTATAIYADRPGAAQHNAVYFADDAEPSQLLAVRVVMRQPVDAWFWPLAVPGFSPDLSSADALRQALWAAERSSASVAAVIQLVRSLAEHGLVDVLLDTLTPQDAYQLSPRLAALPPAAGRGSASGPRLRLPPPSGALHALLRQRCRRWSAEDSRLRWFAAVTLLHDSPGLYEPMQLSLRVQQCLQDLLQPAAVDHPHAPAVQPAIGPTWAVSPRRAELRTDAARQAQPVHIGPPTLAGRFVTLRQPEETHAEAVRRDLPAMPSLQPTAPGPAPSAAAIEVGRRLAGHPLAPREYSSVTRSPSNSQVDRIRAQPGPTQRPASSRARSDLGLESLTNPSGSPSAAVIPDHAIPRYGSKVLVPANRYAEPLTSLPTQAGGLLFLLPILDRLGLPQLLQRDPQWADIRLPQRILLACVTALHVPCDDPIYDALAGTPQSPQDLTELSAPIITVMIAAWQIAIRRYVLRRPRLTLRALVCRPALLHATPTHIDVQFSLAQADLRIRRDGLDLDPGWVPWLFRVVHFHYTPHTPSEPHGS